MRRIFLLALVPLVACSTPQERCIASVTKNIRVLDRLISTSQQNVDRGYAYHTKEYTVFTTVVCGEVDGKKVLCQVPETASRKIPVAINLDNEQAKLNTLRKKRKQLASQSKSQIASCKSSYPET